MIDSFRGPYAFLSNFYASPIAFEGLTYPTLEHAFQAAKTLSTTERLTVWAQFSPTSAKQVGRKVTLQPGWEVIKVQVMSALISEKFKHGTELAKKLLATHPHELVEGTTWGDTFWGVSRGSGENWLGRLLVAQREVLRAHDRLDRKTEGSTKDA